MLALLGVVVAIGQPRPAFASTTIHVNTLDDEVTAGDGHCSLREAIGNFNDIGTTNTQNSDCTTAVGDTTIDFPGLSGTIFAGARRTFEISDQAASLLIDGGVANSNFEITIDMQGDCLDFSHPQPDCPLFYDSNVPHRHFQVDQGANLELQDLNLFDGFAGNQAGGETGGGAVLDYGALSLDNVYLNSNQTGGSVVAVVGNGGAVELHGALSTFTAKNTTFDGNTAQQGGAVWIGDGKASLVNTTFNFNHAFQADALGNSNAGALWVGGASAAATVDYSTFSSNGLTSNAGLIATSDDIVTSGGATITLRDSILADHSPECLATGATFLDGGYNLESGNSCGFTTSTSLPNTDPQFASTATSSNLGLNKTLALSWTSPAIDLIPYQANGCGTTLTFDERGFDRPFNGSCDAGAYEATHLTQAITFDQPSSPQTYGSSFDVSPSSSSGLPVTLAATGVCTSKTFTVTMNFGSGSCDLTASQAGNLYYLPADDVEHWVDASTAELDVSANDKSTTYGTTPTFTASYSGFKFKDGASSLGGSLTFTFNGIFPTVYGPSVTPPTALGTYSITPGGYTSSNYHFVYSPGTYTIAIASQSITVNTTAPSNAAYQSTFTVDATASSGLPVTYTSDGVCTNDGAVFTMNFGSGNCYVHFDQAGNTNYSAATQVAETVEATKLNQTIDVGTAAPASAAYDATFTVAATATSGLTVSYSSDGGCTNTGDQYRMTSGTDTCEVLFNQAGDGNYNSASQVTELVTATKLGQTIEFTSTAPAAAVYGDSYTPTATGGDSGNAVVFGASGACAISGASVVMSSPGTCTVTADQDGNDDYAATTQVTQIFAVGKQPATISFTGSRFWTTGSATATSTSVTLAGTVTPGTGDTVDLTKATITFLLYRSSNVTMTAPDGTCSGGSVSAAGLATCSLTLAADNWTVVMQLPAGNAYFTTGSETEPAVLTVYVPARGSWAAAGGSILDGAGAGNFGFTVTKSRGGHSIYVFQGANGDDYVVNCMASGPAIGMDLSVSFNSSCRVIVLDPTTGLVVPSLGRTNYVGKVNALDGAPDRYSISVYSSQGSVFHQAGSKKSELVVDAGQVLAHP